MFLLALLWSKLRGELNWFHSKEITWSYLKCFAIGSLVATIVISINIISSNLFAWARNIENEFAKILGHLSNVEILLIALTSSIAEESFFRGAMQPALGLIATSLIFGLIHWGPSSKFLPWTIMAIIMGFVLGLLYQWSGSIATPIACHFLINGVNLKRIVTKANRCG
jgi:membrane protease YdiL (CAAX protease family)